MWSRLFVFVLALCVADTPAADVVPDGVITTSISDPTIWSPCAWDPATNDRLAECAIVTVPLDHADLVGAQIDLLVKRRRAQGPASAVIWLVHGGPGASATQGMVDLAHGIPDLRSDITFYAVDHRGVGGSDRLGCARAEAGGSTGGALIVGREWNSCLRSLRRNRDATLGHFTTAAAARDLALVVDKYRASEPVFLYGASYGTYLVRQFLMLDTTPPDGVILEGIVAPDGGMTDYDARFNAQAQAFLATCDAAPACARHFDQPLARAVTSLLENVDDGHCDVLNLDAAVLRQWLAALAIYHETRLLIPPLVHRIKRCSEDDLRFLARLSANLSAKGPDGSYSSVLHNHIVLSEMYRPGPSAAALADQFETAVLSTGIEATYAGLFDHWPRYAAPAAHSVPDFDGPVLGLHGGLDAPAPLEGARAAFTALVGANQNLVVFPHGAHGVTGATQGVDGVDCARRIMLSFVDAPDAKPDTGCITQIVPLDWQTIPPKTIALAGSVDLWDAD